MLHWSARSLFNQGTFTAKARRGQDAPIAVIGREARAHEVVELIDLLNGYVHGGISRRQFLSRAENMQLGA